MVYSTAAQLPTRHGMFHIQSVRDDEGTEHLLIFKGTINQSPNLLVRIHSECLTGEVLGSLKCDCAEQLHAALALIAQEGTGLVIYLRQEGRGIGLFNKVEAYALQDKGMDTIESNLHLGFKIDLREYHMAIDILHHLEVGAIRLLTNNPEKVAAFDNSNIAIIEQVNLSVMPNSYNEEYLNTKKTKLNHSLG